MSNCMVSFSGLYKICPSALSPDLNAWPELQIPNGDLFFLELDRQDCTRIPNHQCAVALLISDVIL